jgi:hypothetical protein
VGYGGFRYSECRLRRQYDRVFPTGVKRVNRRKVAARAS